MKKTSYILLIFFVALASVTCDKKITRAIPVVSPCEFGEANSIVRTNASSPVLNTRKILLEDYTGQFCGNCPKAARRAEYFEKTYGSKLVVIANHVTTTYAQPLPPPDTLYQADYRNDASTEWDNALKISTTPGLPGGAVNRTQPWAVAIADWQARIDAALNASQTAKLVITSYYDSIHFLLKVKVKTTFLHAFTDNINLVIAVTGDSIVGVQKDYAPPVGSAIVEDDARPDYVFNNMVLGAANGALGELVKKSPAVNDTATVSSPCFFVKRCLHTLPDGSCKTTVDDRYVNIVAFLFNTATQEVLQVEKMRIR